jgi:hypothetical protein
VTISILAIDNRRENFTGRISYMSLTLSTQRLLNVSGQIVTNMRSIKKNTVTKDPLKFQQEIVAATETIFLHYLFTVIVSGMLQYLRET